MDDERINCWFSNANPFDNDCYSDDDNRSQHIDMLLMLWAAFLERLATLCNDKDVAKRIIQSAHPLACSVAYYQAANQIHDTNPVAGFANFRDSLKHLVKASISWNIKEEDELPPLRTDLINKTLISAKKHFKNSGSEINEEVLEIAKNQCITMIDYDTTNSWPYSSYAVANNSGIKESHQIALQDLDDIPDISVFGQVIRGPLAIGILASCKRTWIDDLDEESPIHLLVAKAQLFTEYSGELEPGILESIQSDEWPNWAISLLPIVPDI
ncbi:MAG: hypothetical protein DWC06_03280 [Candidatus Poseidoniales archaeon]|nr:MAG: hypothetical protein DWC06_03280 [Candidatus Poseidoniales archaeon]